jgi:hypothetical protein
MDPGSYRIQVMVAQSYRRGAGARTPFVRAAGGGSFLMRRTPRILPRLGPAEVAAKRFQRQPCRESIAHPEPHAPHPIDRACLARRPCPAARPQAQAARLSSSST